MELGKELRPEEERFEDLGVVDCGKPSGTSVKTCRTSMSYVFQSAAFAVNSLLKSFPRVPAS